MPETVDLRPGTVARLDARGCSVLLDGEAGQILWCSVRGLVHLRDRRAQKSPVVVGDRVRVAHSTREQGVVEEVLPRRSMLSRPAVRADHVEHVMAANIDRLLVVGSAADPEFNAGLVDRMLAVAEWCRLEALLVVNKMDLVESAPPPLAAYERMGYRVMPVSARTGVGIDALRKALSEGVSVVAGHSGVGKSSVLNAVEPGLGLAVGEVNEVSRRGTHTTTAAVFQRLASGGAVIDTAGIREFGLFGIPPRELSWLFRDLAAVASGCRFTDCSHGREPGCAVLPAVEEGRIARFRYDSFLRILGGMEEV